MAAGCAFQLGTNPPSYHPILPTPIQTASTIQRWYRRLSTHSIATQQHTSAGFIQQWYCRTTRHLLFLRVAKHVYFLPSYKWLGFARKAIKACTAKLLEHQDTPDSTLRAAILSKFPGFFSSLGFSPTWHLLVARALATTAAELAFHAECELNRMEL